MAASAVDPFSDPAGARVSTEGDRTVVWLSGEHDLASIGLLDASMRSAVEDHDTDVVVDLEALAFMDASTLGSLLRGRSRLADRGRRLTLRTAPRCARLVLDPCDLAHLIEPTPVAARGSDQIGRTALETWVEVPRGDDPARGRGPATQDDEARARVAAPQTDRNSGSRRL